MKIRSHRYTIVGSYADSRKPDDEQWWNPGNPTRSEHTHTQDERQDLCLDNGTSKSIWVWNYQIHFLEEMLLQERELCTLQGVMDANNFNILWTEASWVGNKTLTPHYPNQGNHLYLKQIPSKAHILILLIEKWNNIPSDQGKQTKKQKNNLPWSTESLLSSHMVGWLAGSVKSRGTQSNCYNTGEAVQESFRGFSLCVDMGWCVWMWEVNKQGWTCVHPSSLADEGK